MRMLDYLPNADRKLLLFIHLTFNCPVARFTSNQQYIFAVFVLFQNFCFPKTEHIISSQLRSVLHFGYQFGFGHIKGREMKNMRNIKFSLTLEGSNF